MNEQSKNLHLTLSLSFYPAVAIKYIEVNFNEYYLWMLFLFIYILNTEINIVYANNK